MRRSLAEASLAALLLAGPAVHLRAQSLPPAEPAALGFSPERLAGMEASLRRVVDDGRHAGLVWLVARRGRVASVGAYGSADLEAKRPMRTDTICRVYSMSKIVTSVAALVLFEEGRLALNDPVSRFLPDLEKLQVLTGGTADEPLLTTAAKPITVKHLLTHTSGMYYDFAAGSVLSELFKRAKLDESPSLDEFVKRVARLPLKHQPGEAFTYGVNTDVLGRVIEVASGQPLEEFMRRRIFEPLRMVDTSFDVPAGKMHRLAATYEAKKDRLEAAEPVFATWPEAGRGPALGGAGLFSTIGDYARFAQMLLDGGALDGRRVLGRKTVELMTANHLTHLPGAHHGDRWAGFGLGVEVRIDNGAADVPGSLGQFGWYGAATTYCQIDPREGIVALVFAQHFPFNGERLFERFAAGYYQALVDGPPPPSPAETSAALR